MRIVIRVAIKKTIYSKLDGAVFLHVTFSHRRATDTENEGGNEGTGERKHKN